MSWQHAVPEPLTPAEAKKALAELTLPSAHPSREHAQFHVAKEAASHLIDHVSSDGSLVSVHFHGHASDSDTHSGQVTVQVVGHKPKST